MRSSSYGFILLSHIRVSTICPLLCWEVRVSISRLLLEVFGHYSSPPRQNLGNIWGNESRQKAWVRGGNILVLPPWLAHGKTQLGGSVQRWLSFCQCSIPSALGLGCCVWPGFLQDVVSHLSYNFLRSPEATCASRNGLHQLPYAVCIPGKLVRVGGWSADFPLSYLRISYVTLRGRWPTSQGGSAHNWSQN